jgi:hypothetical protein
MAALLAAVGAPGGNVSSAGFAHPSHASAAALPCRPRAAPAGAGSWRVPGPPCDRVGHWPHEPRTPAPTRTIALMPFPGEQVPGHAACQLDRRRRPRRLAPRNEPSMRRYVRLMGFDPAICVHLLAVSRRCDPLLAKEAAARGGPAAARVKGSGGCSVSDRESPWVTLLTGMWRARAWHLAARLHGCVPRMSRAVGFELRTECRPLMPG